MSVQIPIEPAPQESVSLSYAHVVDFLEKTYRHQNPGKDYHVIYIETGDDSDNSFNMYKSFDEMCSDIAYLFDLNEYVSIPDFNPNTNIVIGVPWTRRTELYSTVVSYTEEIHDAGHPLIYTSSPAMAAKLKKCLVRLAGRLG